MEFHGQEKNVWSLLKFAHWRQFKEITQTIKLIELEEAKQCGKNKQFYSTIRVAFTGKKWYQILEVYTLQIQSSDLADIFEWMKKDLIKVKSKKKNLTK